MSTTMPRLDSVRCEWDEDGLHLTIDGDDPSGEYQASMVTFKVLDPEQLYDAVKAAVGPWIYERDMARREFATVADRHTYEKEHPYEMSDPKHPRHHEVFAEIATMKEDA